MPTPLQQKRVWENMLSAEIRSNYFADLANQYRWCQRVANWATLVLASGAALTIFLDLPRDLQWIRPAFALAATSISAYSVVAQNYDRAYNATDLHARWSRLGRDYENLWDGMDNPKALDRLKGFEEIGSELSKAGITFPNRKTRMLKWRELVEKHHATATQG